MRFVVAFLTPSIQLASLLLIKYTKRDTASPQSLCSGVPSLWNVFTSDLRVVSHGFSLAFFRSLWKYALLGETFPDHFFKMSWIPSYPLIPLPLCVILFKNLSPLMNSHICAEKCTCHICTVDAFWQSEHVYWTALPDRELEHPHRRSTHPLAHALLLSSIAMKCSAGFWILYKQNYIAYIHLCLACLISYFHYSVGSIIWVYSCCFVLFFPAWSYFKFYHCKHDGTGLWLCICISSGYRVKKENFWGMAYMYVQFSYTAKSGCTDLHSSQWYMRLPDDPYPQQRFGWWVF